MTAHVPNLESKVEDEIVRNGSIVSRNGISVADTSRIGTKPPLMREILSMPQTVRDNLAERFNSHGNLGRYLESVQDFNHWSKDELTGLPKGVAFNQRLQEEIDFYQLANSQEGKWMKEAGVNANFSLLMLDVNDFGLFNKHYSFKTGNDVLKSFVDIISKSIKSDVDEFYRLGGDEFAVLLPRTSLEQGRLIAQRIGSNLSSLPSYNILGETFEITSSIGIANYTQTGTDVFYKANQAQIKAKEGKILKGEDNKRSWRTSIVVASEESGNVIKFTNYYDRAA